MHTCYNDILSRIDQEPVWWDENAVPRFDSFLPDDVADIYCSEAALVRIECQNCKHEFDVAFSMNQSMWILFDQMDTPEYKVLQTDEQREIWFNALSPYPLADDIKKGQIHYGDPPNLRCCPAGPTMNCMDIRVLQYWHKKNYRWVRVPELEIKLPNAYSTNL